MSALSIINREKIVLDFEFLQVKANDLKKVRVVSLSSILLYFLERLVFVHKGSSKCEGNTRLGQTINFVSDTFI